MNLTGARKCRLTRGCVRRLSCMMSGYLFDVMLVFEVIFHQTSQHQRCTLEPNQRFLDEKYRYVGIILIK